MKNLRQQWGQEPRWDIKLTEHKRASCNEMASRLEVLVLSRTLTIRGRTWVFVKCSFLPHLNDKKEKRKDRRQMTWICYSILSRTDTQSLNWIETLLVRRARCFGNRDRCIGWRWWRQQKEKKTWGEWIVQENQSSLFERDWQWRNKGDLIVRLG